MMPRPRLVKLVRDRVARHAPPGSTVDYRPIDDPDAAIRELRAKLVEEAVEYLLEPSVAELADVLEVIAGLARHDLGVSPATVAAVARDKCADRGGFADLVGMYVTTTAEVYG
jgi:predicted house-cleaning noncanonical NTP pyrophosphatase (MazG superfamily)